MNVTLSKLAPVTAGLLVNLMGAAPAAGQSSAPAAAPAAAPVSPVALVDQFEATGGKFEG
jgi:hypothetical protein